jgi:hypothetical protein
MSTTIQQRAKEAATFYQTLLMCGNAVSLQSVIADYLTAQQAECEPEITRLMQEAQSLKVEATNSAHSSIRFEQAAQDYLQKLESAESQRDEARAQVAALTERVEALKHKPCSTPFRVLQPGETLQEGDEFFAHTGWVKTVCAGDVLTSGDANLFRRPTAAMEATK